MASLNRKETSSKWFELRVWIREGKNLENRKLIGSNEPFVEVTFGNEIKKTSSKSNLNNVVWDEKLIFRFESWDNMPNCLTIKVKDENTLLPNPLLGEYNLKLDKNMLMNKYQENPNYVIQDGYLSLQNCNQGQLDFQVLLKYCNEFEPKSGLEQQQMNYNQIDSNLNQNMGQSLNQQQSNTWNEQESSDYNNEKKYQTLETHVLPTIHVKAKPTIVEKEIEYNKPVQIKETIIHKEKPIIVEQPIIKETHEHYREEASIEQSKQNVIKHSVDQQQHSGNSDMESLANLRQQYQQQFMDTSPIVQQQKEYVQLDTDYREKPTQVHEKEVVYQQPIEIEKTHIEQVKPVVREDVKVEKEHVYQKLAPEYQQDNVQYVNENEQNNLQDNRQELTQ